MSSLSRRSFLKYSSGALGAKAVAAAAATGDARETAQNGRRTKVYTVFFPTAPSRDDTTLEPTPNEALIRQLQGACRGVEFEVRDLTRGGRLASVLNEAKELTKQGYDPL